MSAFLSFFQNGNDTDFAALFKDHIKAGKQAAEQLHTLLELVPGDSTANLNAITAFEHEGDRIVTRVHELLDEAFIIKKFEKEDISRLAGQLDDIIDDMRDAARYVKSYSIQKVEPAAFQLAQTICGMTADLEILITHLLKLKPAHVTECLAKMKKCEHDADQLRAEVTRKLVASFHDARNSDEKAEAQFLLQAWKDIVAKLERVTDHCAHAVGTVASMVRKF